MNNSTGIQMRLQAALFLQIDTFAKLSDHAQGFCLVLIQKYPLHPQIFFLGNCENHFLNSFLKCRCNFYPLFQVITG